MSLLEL